MSKRGFLPVTVILLILFANPSLAQDVSITLDNDGSLATRSIQLLVVITLLSIVPGLAIMITCFPFMVTVLSILRQGIGLQQSPPNMLIVSLALFLTYFVMEPVFVEAWTVGIDPLLNAAMPLEEAFTKTLEPFRIFMSGRIVPETFEELASLRPGFTPNQPIETSSLSVLIPSFLLSEIERAFQIGFLVFCVRQLAQVHQGRGPQRQDERVEVDSDRRPVLFAVRHAFTRKLASAPVRRL